MIRIGEGKVTSYQKTSDTVTAQDMPQDYPSIFEQVDQKKKPEVASTITVKAGPPMIELTDSIKYLIDTSAGQITSNTVVVDEKNGKIKLDK